MTIQDKPERLEITSSSPLFVTSDLHFFHKRICDFTERKKYTNTEQHNQWLIQQLNKTIPVTTDTVKPITLHLGDMFFSCTNEEAVNILSQLNGDWWFVLGNHCWSSDTEILTKSGWVLAPLITEKHDVATVDLKTNNIYYSNPTNIIVNPPSNLYSIKSNKLDFLVSEEHNIVLDGELKSVNQCLGTYSNDSFLRSSESSYNLGLQEDLNWLRLIVQVICDSTLVRSSPGKCRVQFKLSKQRKIERLKKLLEDLSIPYTFKLCKKTGVNKLQPYYIRIYGQHAKNIFRYLNETKEFPSYWQNLNRIELAAVLEELKNTDGDSTSENLDLVSTSFKDLSTIQTACIKNNINAHINEIGNLSGFKNGRLQYRLIAEFNKTLKNPCKVVTISKTKITDFTYGFSVEFGTVIARRNGKVWVTGNCNPSKLETVINTVNQMKGTNHRLLDWYYRFNIVEKSDVKDKKDFKKLLILCHFPIESWDSMGRGSYHIHGHMHSMTIDHHSGQEMRIIPNRLDCGIDNAYKLYGKHKPFTWKEIKQFMKGSGFVYKEEQAR